VILESVTTIYTTLCDGSNEHRLLPTTSE